MDFVMVIGVVFCILFFVIFVFKIVKGGVEIY